MPVYLSDIVGLTPTVPETPLASKAGKGTVDPYQPGDGVMYGGSYTPELTASTNTTAAKLKASKLLVTRSGPNVLVSGSVNVGTSAALGTLTKFYMTLPIPSDLGYVQDLAGSGTRDCDALLSAASTVLIRGDATGNRAEFKFNSNSANALDITFVFQYGII